MSPFAVGLALGGVFGGAFGLLSFVVLLHAASEGDGRLVPPARRRAAEIERLRDKRGGNQ